MTEQLDCKDPIVRPIIERDHADHILVIGNKRRWAAEGRMTSSLRDFSILNFEDLNAKALRDHTPDIILSPLIGDDFDVIEIVEMLVALGFSGRYRVIAEQLPDADIVRREVAALATGLDFDILMTPQNPTEVPVRAVSDRVQSAPHSLDSARRKASDL
jgi:hypothetical protein